MKNIQISLHIVESCMISKNTLNPQIESSVGFCEVLSNV